MVPMLLIDVVRCSSDVAATRSRKAKVTRLSELLAGGDEWSWPVVVTWLGGALPQRRTGIGWNMLQTLPAPAGGSSLAVETVDTALTKAAHLSGPGSGTARAELIRTLFARATAPEQDWLRRLLVGELRQGASDSLVQDAVALLARVPATQVRRAAMLVGATAPVALAALTAPPGAALAALAAFHLDVGRPVLPMLASSAADVAAGMSAVVAGGPVIIDSKLDGIRIQVHRRDGLVTVVSRSLENLTDRVPELVAMVRGLPGGDLVLDGEALVVGSDGRVLAFQQTASRAASQAGSGTGTVALTPFFFDLLHVDGLDLLDVPLERRLIHLDALVPAAHRTLRLVSESPSEAEEFSRGVVAAGHEGVVLKDPAAPYQAGARGAAWVKVKPVHTLDLVVLGIEHGSGRRRGWLSNIHLGARDEATGEFVMVGKTFKGMTDQMLAWQTERFRHLQTSEDERTVWVRPEQVVEIAVDGAQTSTRYPGGVALRFARVVGYREDKMAAEADTVETVRALLH